ncbi:MAG: hypothetical protein KF858_09665 [Candidatus Sumerlaeia bacterium]|nr:hypothetical protein [Candidatus Sumerlaeia bacterium]
MPKKATTRKAAAAVAPVGDLAPLVREIRTLVEQARRAAASTVNTLQVLTNVEIGRRIVEHEQKGKRRAAYGSELLKELSERLTAECGRGISRSNLQNMRSFFLLWKDRVAEICQQPTGKLALPGKRQQPAGKSAAASDSIAPIPGPSFPLSWTHYVLLLSVKDPAERRFYEIEAAREGWSVPELRRQKASALYERLALSRDKDGIRRLAEEGHRVTRLEELLKEPHVLEFFGLEERHRAQSY